MPKLTPHARVAGGAPDLEGILGLPVGAEAVYVPAHTNNYRAAVNSFRKMRFLALFFHTPEEPVSEGSVFNTPEFFQRSSWGASTHYGLATDGSLYQMVKNEDIAYAQGVDQDNYTAADGYPDGSPLPIWWEQKYGLNANWWGPSIEVEGCSYVLGGTCLGQDPLHETMPIGSDQFKGLVAWVAHQWRLYPEMPRTRDRLLSHGFLDPRRRVDPGDGFPYNALHRHAVVLYERIVHPEDIDLFGGGADGPGDLLLYGDLAYQESLNSLSGTGDNRYQATSATTKQVAAYTGPGTTHQAYQSARHQMVTSRIEQNVAKAKPGNLPVDALELETPETFAGRVPPRRVRMVVRSQQVGRFTPLAIDGRDLRIRFKISYDLDEENKPWEIDVYNLSPENVQRVSELSIGGRFDLAAGYAGEYGLLCGGEIYRIDQIWQPPDRITRFLCGAQDIAMSEIIVSIGWDAEVTILTAIETVARAAGLGVGAVALVPGLQEPLGRYTPFSGTAKRAINYLANLGDAEWTEFCGLILFSPKFTEEIQRTTPQPIFVAETTTVSVVSDAPAIHRLGAGLTQDQVLAAATPTHLVSGTGSQLTPGERERAVYEERQRQEAAKSVLEQSLDPSAIISELHGMIGQPTISEAGIKAKLRMNNGLAPGRLVRLDARVGEGLYRVTTLVHEGDSWQDQFATTIEAATV